MQTAKNRTDMTAKKRSFILLSHMSELRVDPLNKYKAEDVVETLKISIRVLQLKYKDYVGNP